MQLEPWHFCTVHLPVQALQPQACCQAMRQSGKLHSACSVLPQPPIGSLLSLEQPTCMPIWTTACFAVHLPVS